MARVAHIKKRTRLAHIDTVYFGTEWTIELVLAPFSGPLTVLTFIDQIVIEQLELSFKLEEPTIKEETVPSHTALPPQESAQPRSSSRYE